VKPGKVSRCSFLHKNSVDSFQSEQIFPAKDHTSDTERLAMGREVEITALGVGNPIGLRKKSPSLDDVFNHSEGM
jgi:hypothetical protein